MVKLNGSRYIKQYLIERNTIKNNSCFELDLTISVDLSLESMKEIDGHVQQLHQNITRIANGKCY